MMVYNVSSRVFSTFRRESQKQRQPDAGPDRIRMEWSAAPERNNVKQEPPDVSSDVIHSGLSLPSRLASHSSNAQHSSATAYIEGGDDDSAVEFVTSGVSRWALAFTPEVVRSVVPKGHTGTYLLFQGQEPIYIGRSDSCVNTRLSSHNHLQAATHFLWEPTKTIRAAWMLECFWYHRLKGMPTTLNMIHPARPGGSDRTCPFCPDEREALGIALIGIFERRLPR
jgi:hypothetical protein